MNFTSLTFLIFCILVFSLYWAVENRRLQNFLLVVSSYTFYGWWDWRFCFLMLISSSVDFALGLLMYQSEYLRQRKLILSMSIVANLGLLGFFKYANFFVDNLELIATQLGVQLSPFTLKVILPVGISFYTFQTLSYTIDIYRNQLQPTRSLIDYLAFVSFFPQLVAGPIERASHLLPQFLSPRQFNDQMARDGLRQMLVGFFKKMVLADNLAVIVDGTYGNVADQSGAALLMATVCFAFQIYYDFSGYSDIAIGTAKLFGIELMQNFAYPYFSQSVGEFWRRWHISLSTWFRDYVYIPLGGSRASTLGRMRNVLITFIISGFWHGAAWTFGIWGALNGAVLLLETSVGSRVQRVRSQTPGGEGLLPSLMILGRMLLTFLIICLTWVFFRSATLGEAFTILQKIAIDLWNLDSYRLAITAISSQAENQQTLILLVIFIGLEWLRRKHNHILAKIELLRLGRWGIYTATIFAIMTFGTRTAGTFIYFQF